jgi:hypothetical protein
VTPDEQCAPTLRPCAVAGCEQPASWSADRSSYCGPHVNEALMSDDREDFADEYARGRRAEVA